MRPARWVLAATVAWVLTARGVAAEEATSDAAEVIRVLRERNEAQRRDAERRHAEMEKALQALEARLRGAPPVPLPALPLPDPAVAPTDAADADAARDRAIQQLVVQDVRVTQQFIEGPRMAPLIGVRSGVEQPEDVVPLPDRPLAAQRLNPLEHPSDAPALLRFDVGAARVAPPMVVTRDMVDGSCAAPRAAAAEDGVKLFQGPARAILGGSTATDEELALLHGSKRDPKERGFSQADFQAKVRIPVALANRFGFRVLKDEDVDPEDEWSVDMEEALIAVGSTHGLTREEPWQLAVGLQPTDFGLQNVSDFAEYAFLNRAVVATRLLGPDEMAGFGVSARRLLRAGSGEDGSLRSTIYAALQDGGGSDMHSFATAGTSRSAGRPRADASDDTPFADLVASARLENTLQWGRKGFARLGLSGAVGSNGRGEDGRTLLYGGDLTARWFGVDSSLTCAAELMVRDYDVDGYVSGTHTVTDASLRDWGFYVQALYAWGTDAGGGDGFLVGARYELATAHGRTLNGEFLPTPVSDDPLRDDRYRISLLAMWMPEGAVWKSIGLSAVRLQYDYDHAASFADDHEHALWLGIDFNLLEIGLR